MITYDMENSDSTNKRKIYYSLGWHGLFPEEQKVCCKGTRGIGDLMYTGDQNKAKNVVKGRWYSLANLENRMSENIQNIW